MKKGLFVSLLVFIVAIGAFSTSSAGRYATIQEEINASSAGDVVRIKHGVHPEILVLKDGVDLIFNKDVVVWGITDNGSPVACSITGRGYIESPNGNAVVISNDQTNLTIDLIGIVAERGNGILVTAGAATVTTNITASDNGIKILGGDINFTGNATGDAGSGVWSEGGEATVYGNLTSGGSAGVSVFSEGFVNLFGSATATEYGTHGAEAGNGGTLRVNNGVLTTLRDRRDRSALAVYGGAEVYLNQVTLIKTSEFGFGIQGTYDVNWTGTVHCVDVTNLGGIGYEVTLDGNCF